MARQQIDWFTSDLHFHHKKIVDFTDRHRFTTTEEHDVWLINLWREQVKPQDRVFHLGDFSMSRDAKEVQKLIQALPGQKFFIKGNHDQSDHYKGFGGVSWFRDVESYKHLSLTAPMVMCHFPFAVWHRGHYGAYHIHGHSHGNYQPEDGLVLDVGVDNAINLFGHPKFFTLDDIHAFMSKRKFKAYDHHQERKESSPSV